MRQLLGQRTIVVIIQEILGDKPIPINQQCQVCISLGTFQGNISRKTLPSVVDDRLMRRLKKISTDVFFTAQIVVMTLSTKYQHIMVNMKTYPSLLANLDRPM